MQINNKVLCSYQNENIKKNSKWLKRHCAKFDFDYDEILSNINDFIELFQECKISETPFLKNMLYKTGNNIELSETQIDLLFNNIKFQTTEKKIKKEKSTDKSYPA